MEDGHDISYEAGEFANSPAMQLIRRGREEAWKEAQQKIEEEKEKAKAERKAVIRNMLAAGIAHDMIANFMELSPDQLNVYLKQIQEEDKESSSEKEE